MWLICDIQHTLTHFSSGRRGRDCMEVGFTTPCALKLSTGIPLMARCTRYNIM